MNMQRMKRTEDRSNVIAKDIFRKSRDGHFTGI